LRTSAPNPISIGEKAVSSSVIKPSALLRTMAIHRYAIHPAAVLARTDGSRSITSELPMKRQ